MVSYSIDSARKRICGRLSVALFIAVLVSGVPRASAQFNSGGDGLSRQMRLGVRFFERGDDSQSLDQFMYILSRGDPSERALANEYINLITHRMSATGTQPLPADDTRPPSGIPRPRFAIPPKVTLASPIPRTPAPVLGPGRIRQPAVVVDSDEVVPAAPEPRVMPAPRRARPPKPKKLKRRDKELMRREIRAKITAVYESHLKDLRTFNRKLKRKKLLIVLKENGEPSAIGIPSSLLFKSGVTFQKWASRILDPIKGIAFGLSKAQIIVLPEGTAVEDAKVLDMRRTMGISSHLFSAGIAPPRIRVNLLNSQINIPRALRNFRGVIILFVYNKPLNLSVESSVGDEGGPPLSLGIFPSSFDPEKGEGAIIEFSVMDPPAGLVSWKFQLLQPSYGRTNDLVPLQQVVGGGPVYHQIYWNGRKSYFGKSLPPGRYECVLTATDTRNRQRTLHRWITVLGPAETKSRMIQLSGPGDRTRSRAPSADLSGSASSSGLVKKGRKVRRARGKSRRSAKRRSSRRSTKTASRKRRARGRQITSAQRQTPYRLGFESGADVLTASGSKLLSQVAESLSLYGKQKVRLIGYASPEEGGAAELAKKRAERIAGLLINKYKTAPSRIRVDSKVSDGAPAEVEVRFEGGR